MVERLISGAGTGEHMADMTTINRGIIDEFRANAGKVGGSYEGADMVVLHYRGRKSGTEYEIPLMCLVEPANPTTIYVFASKGGAPANPSWYYNLTAEKTTTIEFGTATFPVTVEEITGPERDRLYAEQGRQHPRFVGYEEKTAGIRTIPVIALHRA
jgi:deazaflavin-dependent oxidoreductase (nitroreductase family)